MDSKFSGIFLGGILLLVQLQAQAQSYAESALMFSLTRPASSARIQGMGGGLTALGGDYSLILSNPAGLGMYNRSEITLTPLYATKTYEANYLGASNTTFNNHLSLGGLSAVFHMGRDNGKFLGGSLGISYAQTNDFNGAISYDNNNKETSIIDYFIDNAYGSTTAQFDQGANHYNTPTGLAYFNYLIGPESILNPPGFNDVYFTDVTFIPHQMEDITTSGKSSQWSFSYGANYDDKVFFGAGLGIVNLNYKSSKIFSESYPSNNLISGISLTENLKIKGAGYNITLGTIIRPVDFLQVGMSFNSPTVFNMTDTYDATMDSHWKGFDYYGDGTTILYNESASTDVVTSDYLLSTASKFSLGAALISKIGIASIDVEFINPGSARYSSITQGISYSSENKEIQSSYKTGSNVRLGAEFRINTYRLRAGLGSLGNTLRQNNASNALMYVSAGGGMRFDKFHFDVSWMKGVGQKQEYSPYTFNNYPYTNPVVNLNPSMGNITFTMGFTF